MGYEDKNTEEDQQQAVANDTTQKNNENENAFAQDDSPEAIEMREFQANIEQNAEEKAPPVGNAVGATALTDMADQLDALLASEKTAELGLTDEEKVHFREITAAARNYAGQNKAMLVTDLSTVPKKVSSHLGGAVACYSPEDDFIYLLKGPENHDALNTIVHEVSHALSKDSPDSQRLLELQGQFNEETEKGESKIETVADQIKALDYRLTLTRVEMKGEIDGKIVEEISKHEEEQDDSRTSGYARNIELWRNGEGKEDSAKKAYDSWEKLMGMISNGQLAGDDNANLFNLKVIDYSAAGEQYLIGKGGFPSAADYQE